MRYRLEACIACCCTKQPEVKSAPEKMMQPSDRSKHRCKRLLPLYGLYFHMPGSAGLCTPASPKHMSVHCTTMWGWLRSQQAAGIFQLQHHSWDHHRLCSPLLTEMLCRQDYSNLFKKLRLARTYNEKCSLPPSPVPTHQEALLAI